MFKKSIFAIVLVFSLSAQAFSPSCFLGAKCIKTQGTSIPSEDVIELTEQCREFTRGGIGKRVLRMSLHEINQVSQGNPMHPVFAAHYAFTVLRDSPLEFDRKSNVEDISYEQITRSCQQLNADLNRWLQ